MHTKYMNRCFDLAKLGFGSVSPNPMVGSVIVRNKKIIGEGYHRKYGESHAEVNAINSVKNKEELKEATIYVSLEPCSHYGKTPPCAELIIKSQIPNVVIACLDPNPKVAGRGVKMLEDAGINVELFCLEKKAIELNKRFFTFQNNKRPYVILKWAQSKDCFIDCLRDENNCTPKWLTNEYCRTLVHKWRTEEDAFFVGTDTVILDDPALTSRNWNGNNLATRISIDTNNRIPSKSKILDSSNKSIIFGEGKNNENLDYIKLEEYSISNILSELYNRGIQSIVIEGGSKTLKSFIDQNIWDEARIFTRPNIFEKGINAPKFPFIAKSSEIIGGSTLNIYANE